MTSIMLCLTLALTAMMAELGCAQPAEGPSCENLPKVVPPGIDAFVSHNPFEFEFVLSNSLDCTARVYVQPARGYTNYSGTAFDIRKNHIDINDFLIGADGLTAYLTNCDTGAKQVWHFQYTDLDDPLGANYCAYSCDGASIVEYKCTSNTGYISQKQKDAVAEAKKVPNGDKIHPGQVNCPPNPFCPFYS
uniref:Hydroxynitrile lyase n=1 Tax=Riukiaria semicircularis semicircularis TaxID=1195060 RepID=A0A2Z5XCS1_9MYRI|nr:hydroxynitrile lyase [Riukiaria semicircularis semicircularis]